MSKHPFLTGIGMGAAAGAALGMAMAPKKKEMKAAARKAVTVLQEDYDEVYLTHPLPAHGASCQIPV